MLDNGNLSLNYKTIFCMTYSEKNNCPKSNMLSIELVLHSSHHDIAYNYHNNRARDDGVADN